jgi:glycosyltransferase involved in cell wall biosynthesis
VDGSGLARPWAGVGTYTREVVTAMVAARPDARLTVYAPRGVEADLPGASMRTAPSARLVGRHVLWPVGLRRSGDRAYFGPAGSLPLVTTGLPAVLTAHDMAIYRHPEWFPGRQWLSVKVVVPRSMRAADAIVAVSASTARDLEEVLGVDRQRVTVVHEGVSPSFRPLPEAELAVFRERMALPRTFVLFVSTIEPRKNLATLLDAWGRMSGPPELVVAGGWGWRHQELREKLERLAGRGVRLLGGIGPDQLPAVYNLATVLAHPAWYEGFGLTVLEAMACGTPVIASSASSLPEVVGTSGLLVDPGDVEGWTAALERVLGDGQLRQDLRAHGLQRAAGFTWQRAAAATWQVIDKVL